MPTTAPAAPAHRPPPYALLFRDDPRPARPAPRLLARDLAVEHATPCREALELAARPGLIGALIDVGLDDGSGVDLVEPIRAEHPGAHIVIWSGREEYKVVVQAQRVGCTYLPKATEDEKALKHLAAIWLDAIRARAPFSEVLSERIERFIAYNEVPAPLDELVRLAARGHSQTEIASLLGSKKKTIESRAASLQKKVGLTLTECVDEILGRGPPL